ncbi:MAG: RNA polymerase sigma factor [Burkholderiaceae bacterium]
MAPATAPDDGAPLAAAVQATWHRFLDVYEPLRPDLYRYCRYLTRDPWDAEDLTQDTLARAFVTVGCVFKDLPANPKAWLFRVASNLWIDRQRRIRERPLADQEVPEPAADPPSRADPDAARMLLMRLAPQERAAVVLKDAFDFTLEEIATMLATTVGAVKAALHRGRTRLKAVPPAATTPQRRPVPRAIAEFCAAFNDRDMDRLTRTLLDEASVEIVGLVTEYGSQAARDPDTGSFHGMMFGDLSADDPRGGVDPSLRRGVLSDPPRVDVAWYRDSPIVLFWYAHEDGLAVRSVARIVADSDGIASVRNYFFTPDVIAEVCAELAVPWRVNGYRYWPRAKSAAAANSNSNDPLDPSRSNG